ncbi:iron complex outermembrane recepter protein [Paracidovorax wautersii]|uniref:Iron complex outermembrane recepter protein n=2 Tax=Paracidovorax wautersii TaxID=1177982 RepID=A0A1I2HLK7_9BURK|nr:iron complex outermembrane recepter protein [Paracidovorax wautersii]
MRQPSLALALLALSALLTAGTTVQAQPARLPTSIAIAAQPLGQALNELSRQAGLQLMFPPALVAGKIAPAISGALTPSQALDRLLAGSGLVGTQEGNAIVIKAAPPRPAGAGASLAEVLVTGQAERADGLPLAYAGGQVARGGRLGMLGNADVMDTPFSTTSYTAQLIEDQQASTVLEVLKNDPGVRQTAPTANLSASNFNIRGFGLSADSVTFDGLYGMAPGNGDLSVEFAERVEVLKGPGALLYGMSPGGTVGGSVNLVPKRAGDVPLTRLTLGVESDALLRAQVDTGRRFGANNEWGLRFNGRYKEGDIYIDGAKNQGNLGALALDYRGERLRMTLDAYRLQEKQRGGGSLSAVVSNWDGTPSWLRSMPAAPSARTNLYRGAPQSQETTEAVILGGEYDFSDRWTGYAKFGVQRDKSRGPAFAFVNNVQANGDAVLATDDWPSFNRTKSAEMGLRGRFQTGTVSHAVALSTSYLNRDNGSAATFGSFDQPTNIYRPARIVNWAVAPAYVPRGSETTLSGVALADTLGFMDDRLLLTLGVRRQNVKATNFDETGAVTGAYDASAWTPMVGLVLKPTDDLSLYANVIQGLSQGATVGEMYQNAGDVFPPFKTKQVEVGAKLQTGRFTNTISVFQIKQPSTIADNSTSPLPTLRLNGEQRNRGIEWATFGELTKGLRMLGGLTYLQAKLTKTQDGLQDGNTAAGSPPWAANLGLDWDVPGLAGLAVSGRVTYTSAQDVDIANSLKLPSWTILDLGGRYATKIGGKPVVFRAGVDNVFNRKYWQGVFFNGTVSVGAPRTYRLSAAIDF